MTKNETLMFARQATVDATVTYIEESIRDARIRLCRKWRAANRIERAARLAREHDRIVKLASVVSAAIRLASEPVAAPFPLTRQILRAKAPRKSGTYMMRQFFDAVSISLCQ